jgi:predicted phage-related endonuclease
MDTKAAEYFDLMAQIEQLQAEAEAIRDGFKTLMTEKASEDLIGHTWRATWHNVTNNRLDTKKLKTERPDLYAQYTKTTTTCRFTLNPIKA